MLKLLACACGMSTGVAEPTGISKKDSSGEDAVVTVLSTSAVDVGVANGSALDLDRRSVLRPRRSRRKHAAYRSVQLWEALVRSGQHDTSSAYHAWCFLACSVLQGLRRHYGTFTTVTGVPHCVSMRESFGCF